MSVFSQKFRNTLRKASSWSLAALTAMSCAATLPVLTSTTVSAASYSVDLSNEARGVLYANSRSDFRDESIYFLITTRFYDGDPSNNFRSVSDEEAKNPANDPSWRGDFKGLIEKLDYLKALGFTAIWITPVVQNNSNYDYHGYHASNFNAVDTRYESTGITYQDLIDACHAKGMKVIQDVVFNHTCRNGEEGLNKLGGEVMTNQLSLPWPQMNEVIMSNGAQYDPNNIYHHNTFAGSGDYDNYNAQIMTIADDCFDLETENPVVANYLVDAYKKYIDMGVDAFRVDTARHISRFTMNAAILPKLQAEAERIGNNDFYMFGEVCTRGHDVWYRGVPAISTCFYTWDDTDADKAKWSNTDLANNEALAEACYNNNTSADNQPTSDNAFLNGNDYHQPDYSKRSDMGVIDFQMHWSFENANSAFGTALGEDRYFNDSTWNVVYVNSHDYSPDFCSDKVYTGDTESWAENLSLMFTFRGIPCVYYGTEIEFQKGCPIDKGPKAMLSETGRAYFGDNIEGSLSTTDFGVFEATDGTVKSTLESPLSQHLIRLNRLRQAIPALRKGQYSTEGCSGSSGLAFKRRYTDANVDSFCCVTISGGATFSGVPNGTYVDAVTGDTQNVTGGTLTANCSGKGNLRVYVLSTAKTPAPGRVVPNGSFMGDGGSAVTINGESVSTVKPTGITLSKTSTTILEGETDSVKATITPSGASAAVSWSSSDPSVATVTNGTIKGISKGSATITAKVTDSIKATVSVTVKENTNIVKPTGVTVSPTTLKLTSGESGTLTATVAPSNATDKSVTWTSSDPKVATVADGTVKAVGAGTATITATTSNGLKATASVTVEGPSMTYIDNGVYFQKPSGWGDNINVYMYANDADVGAKWPGTAMKDGGDGIYYYEYTNTTTGLMLVFNDGSHQAPASQGFEFQNKGLYSDSGFVKIIEKPSTVDVTSVSLDKTSATVKKGASVTLTATVSPSNATDKMITWSTSNSSVATVSNGVVTGKAKGTATITAKSSNGKTATAAITVTEESTTTLVNNSSISATSITKGTAVKLTGAASGGTTPYKYAYVVQTPAGDWSVLKDYSTATTHSWTPASTGKYTVQIKVKDNAGTVKVKSFTLNVSSSSALTNNSKISATSVTKGTAVNMTGAATGGTTPYKFAYVVQAPNGNWTVLKDYSTATTHTWTPASTGKYTVQIKVKDNAGTVKVNSFTLNVSSTSALANNSKISATSITKGTTITLTGAASGGTTPYKFAYVAQTPAGEWKVIKDYSTSTSHSWTPASTGKYTVQIKVKDAKNTVVVKSFTLNVSSALVNNSKISATSIAKGTTIKLTGAASGGTTPYKYAYVVQAPNGNWTVLKDYSTATTHSWTPASTGKYTVQVKVKDSKSTVKVKSFTLNVSAAIVNKSTISATTIGKGSSVVLKGAASGGSGYFQYAYVAKAPNGEWYVLKNYSSTESYTFKPASLGKYTVQIKVKDSTGAVNVKEFTLNVNNPIVNNSKVSATSINKGGSVTMTGAASGGTGYFQFAYVAQAPNGKWYVLKDYSSADSYKFTPSSTGKYTLQVKAEDSKGTVSVKSFTLTVSAALVNNSKISATSITKGTTLKLTGAASGGTTPYKYAYVAKTPAGEWKVIKDYSTSTSHSWTPAMTGTYTVQIKVKDAKNTVVVKSFTLKVSAALVNNSKISATSITKGKSVTMTGAASGGTNYYQYAYVVQSPNGNWTVLKDYSSATTHTWTPASYGTYTVQVKVKDTNGTTAVKSFSLKVS